VEAEKALPELQRAGISSPRSTKPKFCWERLWSKPGQSRGDQALRAAVEVRSDSPRVL